MDYSYSLDPTAPKKLSEAWTEFPGGKAWQRQAKSPCRDCNPTVSAEDWFVKPGYVYVGGGEPLDACVPWEAELANAVNALTVVEAEKASLQVENDRLRAEIAQSQTGTIRMVFV